MSSKFKYKQRIISLTYVFVPLALKPRFRESLVQVKNGLVIPSSDLSIIFFMDLKPIRSIISLMSKDTAIAVPVNIDINLSNSLFFCIYCR